MIETFTGKNIAIAGYGVDTAAFADYAVCQGAKVTVLDQDPSVVIPKQFKAVLGPQSLEPLNEYDLVVRSPGVKPALLSSAKQVTSSTQFMLENFREQIIGVTGTKGKGTVSSLVAALLGSVGIRTHVGGNIGRSPLEFIEEIKPTDAIVLELSSFQLMDVTLSPKFAVLLRVEADHLDWHTSLEEYRIAKSQLYRYQKPADQLIYFVETDMDIRQSSANKHAYPDKQAAWYDPTGVYWQEERLVEAEDLQLIGLHNLENICAALVAAHQYLCAQRKPDLNDVNTQQLLAQGLKQFKALPHRLQLVREVNGVRYYNDSYSSNPLATRAAINSFDRPLVVVVGGKDKGLNSTTLVEVLASALQLKHLLLIGETTASLAARLAKQAPHVTFSKVRGTMDQIVQAAATCTQPGDAVVLSPGFASFDMFANFKDRGEQFVKAVEGL